MRKFKKGDILCRKNNPVGRYEFCGYFDGDISHFILKHILTMELVYGYSEDDYVMANFKAQNLEAENRQEGGDQYNLLTKERSHPHYFKNVKHLQEIDVYRVITLFDVTNPCLAHVIKKLLVAGGRGGGKSIEKDVKEAIDSLARFIEMQEEDLKKLTEIED